MPLPQPSTDVIVHCWWCWFLMLWKSLLKGLLLHQVEFSQCLPGAHVYVKCMYRAVCHNWKKKKKIKDTTKPVLQGNGNIHSNSVFQSSVNSLETKQSPFLAILTYPCRTGGRNSNINQSFSLKSAVMWLYTNMKICCCFFFFLIVHSGFSRYIGLQGSCSLLMDVL